MMSHGMEYPIGLAIWVSPTSFLGKLTLSQLNPGQANRVVFSAWCKTQTQIPSVTGLEEKTWAKLL